MSSRRRTTKGRGRSENPFPPAESLNFWGKRGHSSFSSRSHALRGNALSATLCVAACKRSKTCVRPGRGASRRAFPRRAWERDFDGQGAARISILTPCATCLRLVFWRTLSVLDGLTRRRREAFVTHG